MTTSEAHRIVEFITRQAESAAATLHATYADRCAAWAAREAVHMAKTVKP